MLEIYDKILRTTMPITLARRANPFENEEEEYLNLLIDKFASQSLTFLYLSEGIVETRYIQNNKKLKAFDIFSFNSTFRAIVETYIAFKEIFIRKDNVEESKAKFLLWKLEGLFSKSLLSFSDPRIIAIIEKDKLEIQKLEEALMNNNFIKPISQREIKKIFIPGKKYSWKFFAKSNLIEEVGNLKLVEISCRSKGLKNLYKLSSMHTHTGFFSIEQFKLIRGKLMNDEYINAYIVHTIRLTSFLIMDLVNTSPSCKKAYDELDFETRDIIDVTYSTEID